MTRVRALSNHPYGNRMRIKGEEYDVADEDLDLLYTLRRVVPLPKADERAYETRDMQASAPKTASSRPKRRVRESSIEAPAPTPSSSDEF